MKKEPAYNNNSKSGKHCLNVKMYIISFLSQHKLLNKAQIFTALLKNLNLNFI